MNLQVPSHLLLSNKFKGIAVCAVYIFCQHHPFHQLHTENYRYMISTHKVCCFVKANGHQSTRVILPLSEEFGKIESYQLWLEYIPSRHLGSDWEEKLNRVDANGFTQIEVTFESKGPGLEVTKCGAHVVYEQDIEDLKQTMAGAGSSSCIITPYYEDESDDEPEPSHPKWIEHPNLIENWIGNLCT